MLPSQRLDTYLDGKRTCSAKGLILIIVRILKQFIKIWMVLYFSRVNTLTQFTMGRCMRLTIVVSEF